jgi:uncharacterized RDD family membrane protein YckC
LEKGQKRALSTSVNTATLFPDWKQEINRRVAAHMEHKTSSTSKTRVIDDGRPTHASRAAQAAARVAERYAQAPSYSAMLADEARAAVRAAEAASKAAQEAQAAVQYMLEGLEAASTPELVRQSEAVATTAPAPLETPQHRIFDESPMSSSGIQPEQTVEGYDELRGADQPIYANLIQFPREMVATRRMRPRLAEGPLAAAPPQAQLSIFEVDPGSVSTLPAPAIDEPAAPVWMRAEFATIEVEPRTEEDPLDEPAPQDLPPNPIRLAPLSRRLMALIVDASLVLAVFVFAAMQFASHAKQMPGLRTIELGAVLAVFAIGAAYQTLFLTLARATPGMRYAGIALSTFGGHSPSRAQRFGRVMALLLSVLPLGLGLVWALFDDDHLMGHDRLSKTYLRKR